MARMPLLALVVSRVFQAIPVLFGVTFISFGFLNLLPGDTAAAILGENATTQSLRALRHQLNLNHPFLERYWSWLTHALAGHFGVSLTTHEPVAQILAQRVPVTAEIALVAFLEALVLAIPFALLAAWKPSSVVDRFVTVITMFGLSLPNFVLGLILVYVFALRLHFLPATGFQAWSATPLGNIRSIALPSATIGVALFASYVRILRADVVDQLASEEYIQVAKAKGARRGRVLVNHAFRNSLLSLLTVVGLYLGTLLSGTVIVESLFGLPGVGQELFDAISNRDAPVVEAIVVMLAVAVVLMNLLTDIFYALVDPRVRHGRSSS